METRGSRRIRYIRSKLKRRKGEQPATYEETEQQILNREFWSGFPDRRKLGWRQYITLIIWEVKCRYLR